MGRGLDYRRIFETYGQLGLLGVYGVFACVRAESTEIFIQ